MLDFGELHPSDPLRDALERIHAAAADLPQHHSTRPYLFELIRRATQTCHARDRSAIIAALATALDLADVVAGPVAIEVDGKRVDEAGHIEYRIIQAQPDSATIAPDSASVAVWTPIADISDPVTLELVEKFEHQCEPEYDEVMAKAAAAEDQHRSALLALSSDAADDGAVPVAILQPHRIAELQTAELQMASSNGSSRAASPDSANNPTAASSDTHTRRTRPNKKRKYSSVYQERDSDDFDDGPSSSSSSSDTDTDTATHSLAEFLLSDLLAIVTKSKSRKSARKNEPRLRPCYLCLQDITVSTAPVSPSEAMPMLPTGVLACAACQRRVHLDCLQLFCTQTSRSIKDVAAVKRKDWFCLNCIEQPVDIDRILTWRMSTSQSVNGLVSQKEYLVKFKSMSFRELQWMSESWIQGIAVTRLRAAQKRFAAAEDDDIDFDHPPPPPLIADVVPEEYKAVGKILDVRLRGHIEPGSIAHHASPSLDPTSTIEASLQKELARVKKVYVKWSGLDYEEATWSPPLQPSDPHYDGYVRAYKRFLIAYELGTRPLKSINSADRMFRKLKAQPPFINNGTLMDYQIDGLNWMFYKWSQSSPCLLADEMGLGKTIQIISFVSLLHNRFQTRPFLVIVPVSVCDNWVREFNKWAPELIVCAYHGSPVKRAVIRDSEMFAGSDQRTLRCHVVITTYDFAVRESRYFKKFRWELLVVDEGQRLKSEDNLLFKALYDVKAHQRIILTGTPLQNNLQELFNLLNFLDRNKFNSKEMEQKYSDLSKESVAELHELFKPYILRRTKAEVLGELPSKAELIVPVSMTSIQTEMYKAALERNVKLLQSIASFSSVDKSGVTATRKVSLTNILMELRKILNHPYLVDGVEPAFDTREEVHARLVNSCGKLKLLHLMLPVLKERGHRVLIFSQMTRVLDVLEDFLTYEEYKYQRLDGSTANAERQARVDTFNAPDSEDFVFLLSTRAGGVGINLASADVVIIYDMDFNPHADLQALSRAHRIGQTKQVSVFKFITRGSAEERMMQIAKKKLILDHLIIERMDEESLESTDLESIVKFGAKALFEEPTNGEDRSIKYDEASIRSLIDKVYQEHQMQVDVAKESGSFSFAKVFENDANDGEDDESNDAEFWETMLKERIEKTQLVDTADLGRGARRRAKIIQATMAAAVSDKGDELEGDEQDEDYIEQHSSSESSANAQSDEEMPKLPTLVEPAASMPKVSDSSLSPYGGMSRPATPQCPTSTQTHSSRQPSQAAATFSTCIGCKKTTLKVLTEGKHLCTSCGTKQPICDVCGALEGRPTWYGFPEGPYMCSLCARPSKPLVWPSPAKMEQAAPLLPVDKTLTNTDRSILRMIIKNYSSGKVHQLPKDQMDSVRGFLTRYLQAGATSAFAYGASALQSSSLDRTSPRAHRAAASPKPFREASEQSVASDTISFHSKASSRSRIRSPSTEVISFASDDDMEVEHIRCDLCGRPHLGRCPVHIPSVRRQFERRLQSEAPMTPRARRMADMLAGRGLGPRP